MKKVLAWLLLILLMAGCADPGSQEDPTREATEATEATEPAGTTEPVAQYRPVPPIPIDIETNYGKYDLTGDGVSDTLLIRCTDPWEYEDWGTFGYGWQFLVNGEPALEIKTDWPVCPEVELYPVGEDRHYLAVRQRIDTNDDIDDYGLYQYREGKLEEVCSFYCKHLSDSHIFHYGAELKEVSGDRILLRCGNQFNATAYLVWEMEFRYNAYHDTWASTGNVYPVVYEEYMEEKADGMTANRELTVHTSTRCDEVAYTVPKGGLLFIHQICVEAGEVYFQVTNEAGTEGWLKDPEEVYTSIGGEDLFGYFEEAVFAG